MVPTSTEPIGIGSRLPHKTGDVQRTSGNPGNLWILMTEDMSIDEDTANSAHEPHGEPKNYAEALECPDASSWQKAAHEEMTNHLANQTWSLVPHPKKWKWNQVKMGVPPQI